MDDQGVVVRVVAELRAEIARRRVSRKALAQAVGINERQLRRYLNDETPLPLEVLYALCAVLDVDPRHIADRG